MMASQCFHLQQNVIFTISVVELIGSCSDCMWVGLGNMAAYHEMIDLLSRDNKSTCIHTQYLVHQVWRQVVPLIIRVCCSVL